MAKVVVCLDDSYRTTITAGKHVFHADEPEDAGGTDTAATPMQMMLGALGSCIAITTRLYAQRKGWPLTGVEVKLELERFQGKDYSGYEGQSAFVHEIRDQIIFYGPLDDTQRERLLEIAGKCPVHRVIANDAFFITEMAEALSDEPPC